MTCMLQWTLMLPALMEIYVVAHWLFDNGALDRFDRVH
jgi:hypothetical protein